MELLLACYHAMGSPVYCIKVADVSGVYQAITSTAPQTPPLSPSSGSAPQAATLATGAVQGC